MKKFFYIAKETIKRGITVEDAAFYFNNKWELFFVPKDYYIENIKPYKDYFIYEGDDANEMVKEFNEFLLLREIIK